MHIKLIFPGREMRPLEIRSKNHLIPSETLTALAAATPPEHAVTIADENVAPLDLDDRPDLVGITVYTFLAPRAYAIADAYRRRGVPVVLGGLHVTGCPDEALAHADAVFVGEADETWPAYLRDLAAGRPQRVYRTLRSVDVAGLAPPRRELLARPRYLSLASVAATRGCPYSCAYCFQSVDPHYARFRKRPVDAVVADIRRHRRDGDRYVVFFDDNLTVDRAYLRELCRSIAPLGVRWRCAGSIEVAYDQETVRAMADAGCESIFIGLESVNGGALREAGKRHHRRPDYERLLEVFYRHEIMVNGSIVYGFDDDRPDVFERTVAFARAVRLTSINFHILTPYPGTRLFRKMAAEGRLLTRDWARYDTGHVVFQPRRLSPAELQAGYEWSYRELYRWGSIAARLPAGVTQKLRFLAFNLGLKKMNRVWDVLIARDLLLPTFRAYHAADHALWRLGRRVGGRTAAMGVPGLHVLSPHERARAPLPETERSHVA